MRLINMIINFIFLVFGRLKELFLVLKSHILKLVVLLTPKLSLIIFITFLLLISEQIGIVFK